MSDDLYNIAANACAMRVESRPPRQILDLVDANTAMIAALRIVLRDAKDREYVEIHDDELGTIQAQPISLDAIAAVRRALAIALEKP